jgi:hypothetical protein
VAIVGAYLIMVGACALWLGPGAPSLCMFRRLTGLPCATCGSTRMVLALFDLRIVEAFLLNPLMFVLGVLGAVLLATRVVARRRVVWITGAGSRRLVIVTIIMAVLCNWAYLLFVGMKRG